MCDPLRAAIPVVLLAISTATPAIEVAELRDPTRPPSLHQDNVRRLEVRTPQTFVVTAIKISSEGRRALINQKLLSEGDRIGEATIVKIVPGEVVIDYLSRRQRIRLLPYQVRSVPAIQPSEE